jgi:hypothetical protein
VAGTAAVTVDPTSIAAIAEGLGRVAADPALAAGLAKRGREQAARFSWDDTARATLQVYETAVHGGRRPLRVPMPRTDRRERTESGWRSRSPSSRR